MYIQIISLIQLIGCIHTSSSNKSRIMIYVIIQKYCSYIFNQVVSYGKQGFEAIVISSKRGLEESRHLWKTRVRGKSTFVAPTVEKLNTRYYIVLPLLFS